MISTLLELRSSVGPAIRAQILDTLMVRAGWTRQLLEAMQDHPEIVASLDVAHRQSLLNHTDKAIAQLAASVIQHSAETANEDRAKLISSYLKGVAPAGDMDRGEAVFRTACATCHRLGSVGIEIGPDLAALSDKSTIALLTGILDPNRAVLDQYLLYVMATTDGRTLGGIISGETATSVILKQLDGSSLEILRSDIKSLTSIGRSMMPEGLESVITVDGMTDLLDFLKANHAPRKSFARNQPTLIKPDAAGALRLPVSQCEIYGRDVILEEQFGNLGNWHSADDRAVWTVQLDHATEFKIQMNHACDNGSAGNRFLFDGGNEPVRGTVSGTGKWSDYREIEIGPIKLPAGKSRLTFRSDGPVNRALIDLRGLRLEPVRE